MAELKELILKDFSRGERSNDWWELRPNESQYLEGVFHEVGTLRSAEGRLCLNGTEIVASKPVISHAYFNNGTTDYLGAKCNTAIWVGAKESTTVSGSHAANSTTITVATNGALPFPSSGILYINSSELVTYTGKTASTFTGCGSHSAYSGDQTVVDWVFRPLLGQCTYNGTNDYFSARNENQVEFYTPFSTRLYITAGGFSTGTAENVRCARWDGFIYYTGTAACDGAAVVTGTGTAFSTAGVRQGDIIFFKISGSWSLGTNAVTIKQVNSNTTLTLDGNGPNQVAPVDYVIVRVHRVGIEAGTTTTWTATTGGSLTSATTYYGKWRYKNSVTGYTGNFSTVKSAAPGGSNTRLPVGGWDTRPVDRQIDQIEIYGSTDGATYYLQGTVTASTSTYAFAATWNWDTMLTATEDDTDSAWHRQPAADELGRLVAFNNRLYARGTGTTAHYWRLSNMNNVEYWPSLNFGMDDDTVTDATVGGYAILGAGYQEDGIIDYAVEGGGYLSTGNVGSSMLVWTKNRCVRWYGWDWNDFQAAPAFTVGNIAVLNARNGLGSILWWSRNGPQRLEPGTNAPMPIYMKLYPRGYADSVTTAADMVRIRGAVWRDWYVCAYIHGASPSAYSNNRLLLYHIPTDTYCHMWGSTGAPQINDLVAWPDTDILTCADGEKGYIWQLFKKTGSATYWPDAGDPDATSGVPMTVRTRLFLREGYNVKHIHRIVAVFRQPATAQTVTLAVFSNGEDTTAQYTGTHSVSSSGSATWEFGEFAPGVHGRFFEIKVTCTATRQVTTQELRVYYTEESEAWGQDVPS